MPSRSFSKTVAMRGDGKHDRGYRDTRGLFALREYRGGQFSETSRGSFPMMPKLPENGDILRLVDLHASFFTVHSGKSRKSSCFLFLLSNKLNP